MQVLTDVSWSLFQPEMLKVSESGALWMHRRSAPDRHTCSSILLSACGKAKFSALDIEKLQAYVYNKGAQTADYHTNVAST